MDKVLNVTAHPDDAETVYSSAIKASDFALVATNGEASSVNRLGSDFVGIGERKLESQLGLDFLGISKDNQYYIELKDGNLAASKNILAAEIVKIVKQNNITHIRTMGKEGVCNHPDHKASHEASILAKQMLGNEGYQVAIFVLQDDFSTGEIKFPPTREFKNRKLKAMSFHKSQFPIKEYSGIAITPGWIKIDGADFIVEKVWWDSFCFYRKFVIRGESYTLLS